MQKLYILYIFYLFALVLSQNDASFLNKIQFLTDNDTRESLEQHETLESSLKFAEMVKNFGFTPEKLIWAVENTDLQKLRNVKLFLREKILPLVSIGCIGDLLYQIDTLIEYAIDRQNLELCVKNSTWLPQNENQKVCSCSKNLENRLNTNHWALEVLDSFGKISHGVLKANFWMTGNYEQCSEISTSKFNSKYKWKGIFSHVQIALFYDIPYTQIKQIPELTDFQNIMKLKPEEILMTEPENQEHQCSENKVFKMDMCFPDMCSKRDIETLLAIVFHLPQRIIGKQIICKITAQPHTGLNIIEDKVAMIVILALLTVLLFMLFGTGYDYYVYDKVSRSILDQKKDREIQKSSTALFVEQSRQEYFENQKTFVKIVLAFSVYSNGKNIFRTEQKPGQIHCLHGIRFLSLAWIVLAHTYYWAVKYLENPLVSFEMTKYFWNQFIMNASLAVDGFYTISATLLVFLWMKDAKKTSGRNVTNIGQWLMLILHRYFRLTPVYICILVVDIFLLRYLNDGPYWNYDGIEKNFCKDSWWTNLLYVNNFFNLDNQCMTWSWYLANDMQFFVLSPPLLILLWKSEKIGVILITILFFITSFIRAGIVMLHPADFPPISIMMNDVNKLTIMDDFWNDIYVKPYCRCGPYLLGLLLGYFLFKIDTDIKISRKMIALGWISSFCLGFGVIFGLYDYSRTVKISSFYKMIYAAFGRSAWALVICWVIFACATGYGGFINKFLSSKVWMPLSRLIYCAYLIHPIVIMCFYASETRPIYFASHYHFVLKFLANIVLSFVIALMFSLACEIPVLSLEKLLFRKKHHSDKGNSVLTTSNNSDNSTRTGERKKSGENSRNGFRHLDEIFSTGSGGKEFEKFLPQKQTDFDSKC